MKQTTPQKKIGVVCLALLALAAVPLASADPVPDTGEETHLFIDLNGDGDCTDAGEHKVLPTPKSQGRIWIGCPPF